MCLPRVRILGCKDPGSEHYFGICPSNLWVRFILVSHVYIRYQRCCLRCEIKLGGEWLKECCRSEKVEKIWVPLCQSVSNVWASFAGTSVASLGRLILQ